MESPLIRDPSYKGQRLIVSLTKGLNSSNKK